MLQQSKVLIVEDDRTTATALSIALKSDYQIDLVGNGKAAIYRTDTYNFDLLILDLNLPDITGLQVCQLLRERGFQAPILILSGQNQVMSKVHLLDAGANDYLTKPCSLGELQARIRALLRNKPQLVWPKRNIESMGVVLDRKTFSVTRDGTAINLRIKEFAVLECLVEKSGEVVERSQLINYVWKGVESPWNNTLDVHIKHLRDKLDRPFNIPLIHTVHGRGYSFDKRLVIKKFNSESIHE